LLRAALQALALSAYPGQIVKRENRSRESPVFYPDLRYTQTRLSPVRTPLPREQRARHRLRRVVVILSK
jgi:hypothetical protein